MRKFTLPGIGFAFFLYTTAGGQTEIKPPRISVPDINGRAISLVKPAFPETAVAAQADGSGVSLKVVVDENGDVVSAQCSLNCHPMLKDAAELAAATSKFRPLIKDGLAVRYEGILLYTFVVDRIDWFRFGTALESTRQFDNISLGPVAQMLSTKFASEKTRLLDLDEKGVELETRWKVIREIESALKKKLKDGDLWRFEIAMALRRITFWTMAGGKTNRVELQSAIDELPRVIAAAPDDIPEKTIQALGVVAKYRVPADLPERDLRQAIMALARTIRIEQ